MCSRRGGDEDCEEKERHQDPDRGKDVGDPEARGGSPDREGGDGGEHQ
jgi:hypothetical protein